MGIIPSCAFISGWGHGGCGRIDSLGTDHWTCFEFVATLQARPHAFYEGPRSIPEFCRSYAALYGTLYGLSSDLSANRIMLDNSNDS